MKWSDSTSYSRGERGVVEPRAWRLDGCPFRVEVHGRHGLEGVWFVSCHDLNVDSAQLAATTADVAKIAAIAYVRARLRALTAAFDKATSTDTKGSERR